jgi:hypothetical protein
MTQLTSITTRQNFTTFIQLEPNERAHVEVEIDFPVSAADDAVVTVEATLDASTENWDDTPVLQFAIDEGTDPNKKAFILEGHYKYRIGVERISGGSDTLTSADCSYRIGTMS